MAEIIPIRGNFENFHAYLAHIASDGNIVGIAGAVIRICKKDGSRETVPIYFDATIGEIATVAAMLLREAAKTPEDDKHG